MKYRVLWFVPTGTGWLGGVNYFRNLLFALQSLPEAKIEPIIATDLGQLPTPLNKCDYFLYEPDQARSTLSGLIAWIKNILTDRAELRDEIKKHGISAISHSQTKYLSAKAGIPEICWIADFQHIHLPNFFTKKEILSRNMHFRKIAKQATTVILSSETARHDFIKLFPDQANKAKVLHFVANPVSISNEVNTKEILNTYNINQNFIHLPNQLWAHKNHKVVIEALHILYKKDKQNCPLIISTGSTKDYRNPKLFDELIKLVKEYQLEDKFKFLGIVSYETLFTLMQESIAIINPSLFEGWSTTVEEGKSMGKKLILSDIPVHIEQAPERGIYFSPNSPEDLANKIQNVIVNYNIEDELLFNKKAKADLMQRMHAYAESYQNLILETILP